MKQIILVVLILISIPLKAQEKELQGFGKIKLGMTITEVERILNKDFDHSGSYHFSVPVESAFITNDIRLFDIRLTFQNQELVIISSDFSNHLHNGISKLYGIKTTNNDSSGGKYYEYKTNNQEVISLGLTNENIMVFFKSYKLSVFDAMFYPVYKLYSQNENFEGL